MDRYRVIYDVIDEQVVIRTVAMGHRGDIHRNLGR
ncbi:type II toxin-antitoxin system RelE family toxin [Nocardiopsis terrae]